MDVMQGVSGAGTLGDWFAAHSKEIITYTAVVLLG